MMSGGANSFLILFSFPDCPCSGEISDTSQEPSLPKACAVTRSGSSHKSGVHMSPQLHGSESGNHKGKVKVSGKESLCWLDHLHSIIV